VGIGRRAPSRRVARNSNSSVLKGISLALSHGKTLGVVGESGSGKSTLGRAILGLAPIDSGAIAFEGRDITHASKKDRRALSSSLQVVFQDPYTSLNPSLSVGSILAEPLIASGVGRGAARSRIANLLDQVALPSDSIHRRPSEFSGGQRQRIAIARAIALRPKLVICDEPVSALDLLNQARILDLFLEIQHETEVAYLFISHDLDVVRHMSHDVSVIYQGRFVESGPTEQVVTRPQQSYTKNLLLAAPVANVDRQCQRRTERLALRAQTRQHMLKVDSDAVYN